MLRKGGDILHSGNRILLCTNHLFRWAGSEVVLLELAEEAASYGLSVSVLANEFSGSVKKELKKVTNKLYTTEKDIDLFSFDIIYSQHHISSLLVEKALSDSNEKMGRFPFLIYNHLSSFDPYEVPGPFIERSLADLILANSRETANKLAEYGKPFDSTQVFANPAPQRFMNAKPLNSNELSKLLVISNHLPGEIKKAVKILEKANIQTTIVGRKFRQDRVTPSLIAQHDALVTIGKSVQYSMLSSRPVYCYDHFGGPGWLDSLEKFQLASEYNFSGRCTRNVRSSSTIANELINGFSGAKDFQNSLPNEEIKHFCLNVQFEELVKRATVALNSAERSSAKWELWNDPDFRGSVKHEARIVRLAQREYKTRRKLERRVQLLNRISSFSQFKRSVFGGGK